MSKFKFGEADTGGGAFFDIKNLATNGHPVLVRATAEVKNKDFKGHFKADVVEADMVDLETGDAWYLTDVKNTVPRKAFAEFVGGDPLLVKFTFGTKEVNGSKVILFENLTGDPTAVAKAEAYLDSHPGFLSGADRDAYLAEQDAKENGASKPSNPEAAAKAALGALGATTVTTEVKTIPKAIYDSLDAAGKAKLDADGYQVV